MTTTSLPEWNGLMGANLGGVFLRARQTTPLLERRREVIVSKGPLPYAGFAPLDQLRIAQNRRRLA